MTTQHPAIHTILLVEDEPLLRLVLQETLEDSGYRVEEAESGDIAWGLVERGLKFDILLTDVRMPGYINGLELARKVVIAHEVGIKVLRRGRLADSPYGCHHRHFMF